jgi:hypothetical protein
MKIAPYLGATPGFVILGLVIGLFLRAFSLAFF